MPVELPPDEVALFLLAQRTFGERVQAVSADQWHHGTPATQWSVADLVGHLVDEHRWAVPLMHGLDLHAAALVVDGARNLPVDGGSGANLAQEWKEAAAASADVFTAADALERDVEISRGHVKARAYIRELTFDLTIHSWDLASAIGYPHPIDADLVAEMHARLVRAGGDLSMSGLFDAPVPVPNDAPTVDKLVAMTGRVPR